MMDKAELSTQARNAVLQLFEADSSPFDLLTLRDASYPRDASTQDPARQTVKQLEKFLIQMAAEAEEMGCDEASDTLRMQATGLLIAIREIHQCFPELIDGEG